jgi:uncharacterized protein YebE (UPF0316 family)
LGFLSPSFGSWPSDKYFSTWIIGFYPAGFATGILVGMIIEERIAYGKVIVRIITRKDTAELKNFLNAKSYRFTEVDGHGAEGPEHVIFTVLEREHLETMLEKLKEIIPSAFYTVEKVNRAAEGGTVIQESTRWSIASWLKGVRRQ